MITVTIRPHRRWTEVRGLPYEGAGAGYSIIGTMIGATRKDQVKYERGASASPGRTPLTSSKGWPTGTGGSTSSSTAE